MILYHGTNVSFDTIELSKSLPFKDFGSGFYVTDILEQAQRMAARKSRRFGTPTILSYEFDESVLTHDSGLKIKLFGKPTEEWAEFVLKNRERTNPPFQHPYDIIVGPVADDGIAYILDRYKEGSFTMADVVRELEFAHLNRQYYFGTEKAIALLKKI